ncbi:unnamed protein product [Hermetia illucens]|uniref:(S)-2-hydroxy-acid oxidase n=1 Tax=Hermetia illucens TaxID=343691 RepID=A0A7R8Z029_HERIL|nr:hydroxyacid oxidase 1-like [Hermetia illucens]CAD7088336.1 unnamed protein product [Hermetia illucens]
MALVCVEDYEKEAFRNIPKNALEFYRSGAGSEFSLTLNIDAFKRWRILPRFLRDVGEVNTDCNVLGYKLSTPIGVAPTGMQRTVHDDGEIGNARAVGKVGGIFILSTVSTTSLEEVAEAAPNTTKWFQLYIYKDQSLTESLVRRAENVGYKAIVLTADVPCFGARRADARNKFKLPPHLGLLNFQEDGSSNVKNMQGFSGINEYVTAQFDPTITWTDVDWLVKFTKLPVVVKGVLTREDALLARDHGCRGIIVSNHGARQLDSVPATIEVLPTIVDAVGNDMTIMLDGGVRQGTDVFKALALGAKAVFMGRPLIWGLAVNGQKGAEHVLELVQRDLELTMKLSGCVNMSDITKDYVAHESQFSKL